MRFWGKVYASPKNSPIRTESNAHRTAYPSAASDARTKNSFDAFNLDCISANKPNISYASVVIMNVELANRTSDTTTRRVWYKLGSMHYFERPGKAGALGLRNTIFVAHQLQASVIFAWAAVPIYQLAWQGTFDGWAANPSAGSPAAHAIRDPHFATQVVEAYAYGTGVLSIPCTTGLYEWLYTIGLRTSAD